MKAFSQRVAVVLMVLLSFQASAITRYVDVNSTNPVPPYATWSTAATNIQDAIEAANAGDFVLVSNGVYNTGGRAVYGIATNRVTVDKAVTVQSVNGAASTIIAGFRSAASDYQIRCAYLTNGASLIGFTLTNGNCRHTGNILSEESGGGVWCEDNSAVVSNCVLTGNTAPAYGGGAFQGTLFNCILGNNNGGFGGGACSNILVNCTLIKNIANQQNYNSGGGAFYCTLSNCLVVGNVCNGGRGGGGAYYCTLTACVISNNAATSGGGVCLGVVNNSIVCSNFALLSGGGAISNILNHCILSANNGGKQGGGACQSTLNNCTVANNTASDFGGGAYGGILNNCTVVSNSVDGPGGGVAAATLNNCISYYNANKFNALDPNVTGGILNYCCTTPPPTNGVGNITNEPVLVSLATGDLHLQSNSPCINSGHNTYAAGATDLDGNPRIVGGTVDMGAYEFQTPTSVISYAWLQQYGLPTDGTADYLDSDGDGMNNRQEWKTGTNPTNALSVLKLTSAAPTNNPAGLVVTWQSVSGITYLLQSSGNLGAQPAFQTIQADIPGQVGTTSYLDTNAVGSGPFFYRVGVQ
ncbi:MAG: thrombospondin type 3 repeat-containing protein [Verrucomicrobiia bacterium]